MNSPSDKHLHKICNDSLDVYTILDTQKLKLGGAADIPEEQELWPSPFVSDIF